MANPKWKEWVESDRLILLQGWARQGLTNEQIAHNMGINPDTFYTWKKEHSEISDALKEGKEVVDFMVENALLKNALEGNTTAQIFWLKNRRSDLWRDKVEQEVTHNMENIGVIEIPVAMEEPSESEVMKQ